MTKDSNVNVEIGRRTTKAPIVLVVKMFSVGDAFVRCVISAFRKRVNDMTLPSVKVALPIRDAMLVGMT